MPDSQSVDYCNKCNYQLTMSSRCHRCERALADAEFDKSQRSAKIEELIRKVMEDQSVYYDTPEEDDALCSNCHKSLVRDGLPYDYCFNPDCCAFQLRELLKAGE